MKLTIIAGPYSAGKLNQGMGQGPTRYLQARPEAMLSESGHDVAVVTPRPDLAAAVTEPEAVARIDAALALAVGDALASGRFPLVLAGNCNSCLGTLAGLQGGSGAPSPATGIVWFDAHGDLNTPESSSYGFFDGMGLAIATGRAYAETRQHAGLASPIPESRVLHVGSRDLDAPELAYLENSPVAWLSAGDLQRGGLTTPLAEALRALRAQVEAVYLHIDIDVLSGAFAPGVDFPSPGGLTLDELEGAVQMVGRKFTVRAAALTAYDPDHEREKTTLHSGLRLMQVIAEAV
jgi:arginase